MTIIKDYLNVTSGGSKGGARDAPPRVQILSFSCSFRQKNCKTRMHSSRMRTTRSLTVSHCALCMPPSNHAHPPATMHAPCNHACPLQTTHTPGNHACSPATTHAPQQPHMPPTIMHTPCQPCMPLQQPHMPPGNHACPQQPCMPP